MPREVTATYRLQLSREFPLAAARGLVPYLEQLGVSHMYLSPVLAARSGSTHGYDVVDPARLNPELGAEDELRALSDDLHARGMGIVLDIVPNHMAAAATNAWWDNVLERGHASRFAEWFDVDWDAPRAAGKVVLPVLGDELEAVLERGEIEPEVRENGARVRYFDASFPLDPATVPRELQLAQLDPAAGIGVDQWAAGADGRRRLRELLMRQHYLLCFWRRARTEINYRRFFDVNDLVALRMETDDVFEATHGVVLGWIRDGILDGLRVDHVDGLRNPAWYLAKLRAEVDAARHAEAPRPFPIFVEKILAGDEALPRDWPVAGTTGYDFLNAVEEIFLDADGFRRIEAWYRALRHNPSLDFRAVALDAKRRALREALWPDVLRVARVARAWRPDVEEDSMAGAIVEVIAQLEPYRTYVIEPGMLGDSDGTFLGRAFQAARASARADPRSLDLLEDAFFATPSPQDRRRAELVARFQQTAAPAAAKGVEDTALYVYHPLASRNEVGGTPDRSLDDAAKRLHASNVHRSTHWPRAMLATSTHDTKRSADLRARLDVLTAMPGEWARHVTRWRRLNRHRKRVVRGRPAPDTNSEYLYYQTLFGLWPASRAGRRADDLPAREWLDRARERLVAYMAKAAREAKSRTTWTERDDQFEAALDAFVRESLTPGDDDPFLPDVGRLAAGATPMGQRIALARVVVHCLSPGLPDIYQGDEHWHFALVDPDNRLPVDFETRRRELARVHPHLLRESLGHARGDIGDAVKLALVARLLRLRRDHPRLFLDGDYDPLFLVASRPRVDIFGFVRRRASEVCIAIVRTRSTTADETASVHEPVSLPSDLEGRWHSVLTGRVVELVRFGPQLTAETAMLVPEAQPCEVLLQVNR